MSRPTVSVFPESAPDLCMYSKLKDSRSIHVSSHVNFKKVHSILKNPLIAASPQASSTLIFGRPVVSCLIL